MNLPVFLPIEEAASKYQIPLTVLTRLVQDGKIEAIQLDGRVAVSEESLKTKEQIIKERFSCLVGQPITISEAVEKYHITSHQTIRNWVARGYVKVVDGGYPTKLDEADVAYCADVYRQRQALGGVPLLDETGRPYELKRPELAEYRRRKKKVA